MRPLFFAYNLECSNIAYPKESPELCVAHAFRAFLSQISYLVGSKFRRGGLFTSQVKSEGFCMSGITFSVAPLKVFYSIISRIRVEMVDAVKFFRILYKGFCDKPVYKMPPHLLVLIHQKNDLVASGYLDVFQQPTTARTPHTTVWCDFIKSLVTLNLKHICTIS